MTEDQHVPGAADRGAVSGQQSLMSGKWVWIASFWVLAVVVVASVITVILDDQIRGLGFWVVGSGTGIIVVAVWLSVCLKFGLRGLASLQVLSMVLIVAVALLAVIYSENMRRFAGTSYVAVLIMSFVGAATVILPSPSAVGVVTFSAALGDPIGVGLVAAAGQTAGELIAYYVGVTGKRLVEHGPGYQRVRGLLQRRGKVAGFLILGLAAFPNPFFDAVGLVAGALRFSLWRFAVLAWVGNSFKYIVIFGGIGSPLLKLLQGS